MNRLILITDNPDPQKLIIKLIRYATPIPAVAAKIPNLKFSGVPKVLKKTVYTFKYNDFDNLKKIVEKDKEIGIIIMEVERDIPPKFGFLDKVKKLAKKNSIILIFDECTSGFSETFGGIHLKHKVKKIFVFLKILILTSLCNKFM